MSRLNQIFKTTIKRSTAVVIVVSILALISVVESGVVDGKYVAVYGYNEMLTPKSSITVLSSSLTMVEMSTQDLVISMLP